MASRWREWQPLLLEAFLISNFGFLVVDIFVAHSVNEFHHWAEWIPFVFSIVAAPVLCVGMLGHGVRDRTRRYRAIGYIVGSTAIVVGIAGLLWHLQSQFFVAYTVKSLVYTAPFVAPLSYTGLGFLTLLSRMESRDGKVMGLWVTFLALGGFLGNFILSLCDHAQNGFYHLTEWIPVAASAYGVAFLTTALFDVGRQFLRLTLWVMLVQIVVGVLGFVLHLEADINGISASYYRNFIHGAPIFAPLLFANLALLAMLGVYDVLTRFDTDPSLAGSVPTS